MKIGLYVLPVLLLAAGIFTWLRTAPPNPAPPAAAPPGAPVKWAREAPAAGPVQTREHNFVSADGRALKAKIFVPPGQGPFATVVFSPSKGMDIGDYSDLGLALAKAGILWIQLDHPHSNGVMVADQRKNLRRYGSMKRPSWDAQLRKERLLDMRLVMEKIGEIPEADSSRLGVCGHLSGGFAAQALAGAKVDIDGQIHDWSDKRIRAAAIFSPYGLGATGMGFAEGSWAEVATPMLLMSVVKNLPPMIESTFVFDDSVFTALPGRSPAYYVKFNGGGAMSFIGWNEALKLREMIYSPLIVRLTALFFNAYLNQDAEAKGLLDQGDRLDFLNGKISEFRRK